MAITDPLCSAASIIALHNRSDRGTMQVISAACRTNKGHNRALHRIRIAAFLAQCSQYLGLGRRADAWQSGPAVRLFRDGLGHVLGAGSVRACSSALWQAVVRSRIRAGGRRRPTGNRSDRAAPPVRQPAALHPRGTAQRCAEAADRRPDEWAFRHAAARHRGADARTVRSLCDRLGRCQNGAAERRRIRSG